MLYIVSFLFTRYITNESHKIMVEEYKSEPQIVECKTDKIIPEDYFPGKVVEFTGNNEEEMKMLSQFKSFYQNLLQGDIDKAIYSMNSDAIKYFLGDQPQGYDFKQMQKHLESISTSMIEQKKRFASHGVEIEIVVSRIIRKVSKKDIIFYVFETVNNFFNEHLQLHTTPDLVLAISTSKGEKWSFVAINNKTDSFLKKYFPSVIIDKVMK